MTKKFHLISIVNFTPFTRKNDDICTIILSLLRDKSQRKKSIFCPAPETDLFTRNGEYFWLRR
jgi:hypothetical protein